jgi:hypothetical protein
VLNSKLAWLFEVSQTDERTQRFAAQGAGVVLRPSGLARRRFFALRSCVPKQASSST